MTGDPNVDRALQVLSLIQTQYPQLVPLLQVDPDIMRIFTDVMNDPSAWPPERIQAAIANTPWFRDNPASSRNWAVLAAVDPATARQQAVNMDSLVKQIAGQMGIPPNQIDALMVLQAAAENWDETRIRRELVARLNGATQLGPGGIGELMNEYGATALKDYGVHINDQDLFWWAANTMGGTVTQQGFQDFLTMQAKNLYPALTYAIDQGITPSMFAGSYFALAEKELGINPAMLSVANPHWMNLVLGTDGKGNQGIRSLDEALTMLRTDPSYGYDKGLPGRSAAAQLATQVRELMGAK